MRPLLSRCTLWMVLLLVAACRQTPVDTPPQDSIQEPIRLEESLPELFRVVQLAGVFEDSKTFVDCELLASPAEIQAAYLAQKDEAGFVLNTFVNQYFQVPISISSDFEADTSRSVAEHIEALWPVLSRQADQPGANTRIPLPHPYIVPGGRFREIYYWDSYFTMLGLQVSDTAQGMIRSMVENFAYEIDTIGFIPNGNRTYFLGRSQPPFFAMMVGLLAEVEGEAVLAEFAPSMEKEYAFWMEGADQLTEAHPTYRRVVRLGEGVILNRYWDNFATPRPESYEEDVVLGLSTKRPAEELYRDLRAGCESGWDFSSRWLRDGKSLYTIHTTDIIPPDLNALLYQLEMTLSRAFGVAGDKAKSQSYAQAAEKRKQAVAAYNWDPKEQTFQDYDFVAGAPTNRLSAAMMYPLAVGMATEEQAAGTKAAMEAQLLQPGGIRSTPVQTGQQWDAPNGWAPLQWMTIAGLRQYGYQAEAADIKQRWITLNTRVYQNTGKMVEKYNVSDLSLLAGGGEYALQDGFGWSNGVLLRLLSE